MAITDEAAKQALINHVLKGGQENALKVALLTRDSMPVLVEKVVQGLLAKITCRLQKQDRSLVVEGVFPKVQSKPYAGYSWRSPNWERSWVIGFEFQSGGLMGCGWGFAAKTEQAIAGFAAEERGDFVALDGARREAASRAIRNARLRGNLAYRPGDHWVAWLTSDGLGNWQDTEFLLKAAGHMPHEGMPLADWFAKEFIEIRKALCGEIG